MVFRTDYWNVPIDMHTYKRTWYNTFMEFPVLIEVFHRTSFVKPLFRDCIIRFQSFLSSDALGTVERSWIFEYDCSFSYSHGIPINTTVNSILLSLFLNQGGLEGDVSTALKDSHSFAPLHIQIGFIFTTHKTNFLFARLHVILVVQPTDFVGNYFLLISCILYF